MAKSKERKAVSGGRAQHPHKTFERNNKHGKSKKPARGLQISKQSPKSKGRAEQPSSRPMLGEHNTAFPDAAEPSLGLLLRQEMHMMKTSKPPS